MYRLFGKYIVSLCLVLAISVHVFAQVDLSARTVIFEGIDQKYLPNVQKLDTAKLDLTCKNIILELRKDGYWLASVDSKLYEADTVKVQCFQGRKFDKVNISLVDETGLSNGLSRRVKKKPKHVSSLENVEVVTELLLHELESNGYPFAQLKLDSSRFENDQLYVHLRIDTGAKITYDSLDVNPVGLVKPVFLSKYLGLNYGDVYNENDLAQIEDKVQHLPFLSLDKVGSSFQLKKAKVYLDVSPRKINYFDGILGLVPGRDGEGIEVTGELNLSINNLFHSGKKVEVNWNKLEPGSQMLKANYLHPILLGSPLDFYFSLNQIRQDTIYSNRSIQLAFDYRPLKNVRMRLNYENLLGNELGDENGASGDFNIDYYGMAITWYKLDDLFNPKDGIRIYSEGKIGRKSISDQGIDDSESSQYSFRGNLEWFKRLSPRSVLFLGFQNGLVYNDILYLNDLFRIGGLKSIRGFNELEFFASKYAILNLEWRYYIDASSYLLTFYDQSFLSYEILSGSFEDRPMGFGMGMQFSTERGQFKLLYGLGKRNGESISFSNSKIHFGYTAIF